VVSASFMLQVNLWLTSKVGDPLLARAFWAAAIAAATISLAYAAIARPFIIRICAVILIFSLAYILGLWQTYFEERTHILMYGLLGFLAMRDLAGSGKALKFKSIALSMAFTAVISALDEAFQLILPYRFGEMKDFYTNVLGAALGVALFLAVRRRGYGSHITGNA